MFQTNYIFKAQYLGRRLESIYRVARRWKITNEEAAELMVNVEIQQSDNKLNQKQHLKYFKYFINIFEILIGIIEPLISLITCLLITYDNNFLSALLFNFKSSHHVIVTVSQALGNSLLYISMSQFVIWNKVNDLNAKKYWLGIIIFADVHRITTYGKHLFYDEHPFGFTVFIYYMYYLLIG